jgi:pantoate--beta-alanine ligase
LSAAAAIEVVRTVADLRRRVGEWRKGGASVGLVPTMGALHGGHLALVRRSLAATARTCVTIFVNPKQFGPSEDFAAYPRAEADDVEMLAEAGAHLAFAPAVAEMYPPGHATKVAVEGLGDRLEGEFRPGFFAGVATVVTKLLLQALPDRAFFGEKDFQQLLVVRRLVADLAIPVAVEGVPTVREADGLALSSRNAYLAPAERRAAPALFRTLSAVAEAMRRGAAAAEEAAKAKEMLSRAGFRKVDYVAVADAETLAPVERLAEAGGRPVRALAAAWLGRTRLIDNVAV